MRYSNNFKLECVNLYYEGKYLDTPEGISEKRFHKTVRSWVRLYEAGGIDALFHHPRNKNWTPEQRYELVAKVIAGEACRTVALSAGINSGQLYQWVCKYRILGYNGLMLKKGRKPKNPDMKKVGTRKPPKPNESEYEELIRLRAENAYMKAEIEVIKKEIALREEKEAARLKAKKQRSSKNSVPKDSN